MSEEIVIIVIVLSLINGVILWWAMGKYNEEVGEINRKNDAFWSDADKKIFEEMERRDWP